MLSLSAEEHSCTSMSSSPSSPSSLSPRITKSTAVVSDTKTTTTTTTVTTSATRLTSRNVHFDSNAHIYRIPTLSELTAEETQSLWITREDEEGSRDDAASNVCVMRKLVKKGYNTDEILNGAEDDVCNEGVCFRGLEHMITSEHSKKKKVRRRRVFDTVLDEQERQRCIGEYDEDLLADASAFASTYARLMAVDLAAKDAQYIVSHVLPTILGSSSSIRGSSSSTVSVQSTPGSSTRRTKPSSKKFVRPEAPFIDTEDVSPELDSSSSPKQLRVPSGTEDLRDNLAGINLLGDSEEMKDEVASVLSTFARTRLSKLLGKPPPPSSLIHHQAAASPCQRAAQTA